MKCLITGGAGFIGSYLTEVISNNNIECIVVDNLFQNSYTNIEKINNVRFYKIDITNKDELNKVFAAERPDQVYHLAAHHFIPYCNKNPIETIDVNIKGTQIVTDVCKENNVTKMFFASSAAIYKISDDPHTEEETPEPNDIYGITKYCGEMIVKTLHESSDIHVIIGRIFNAIGSRETNPHVLPEILKQIRRTISNPIVQVGNIQPKRDYIHAYDIANAVYSIMKQTSRDFDIINIGSGKEYSVYEMITTIQQALDKEVQVRMDDTRVRKNDRIHLCANNYKLSERYKYKFKYDFEAALREQVEMLKC